MAGYRDYGTTFPVKRNFQKLNKMPLTFEFVGGGGKVKDFLVSKLDTFSGTRNSITIGSSGDLSSSCLSTRFDLFHTT